MSRKDKVDRNPVPEEPLEQFLVIGNILMRTYGLSENKRVTPYWDNLQQAVEREIFEMTHKVPVKDKMAADLKKYVAIFRQRYLQSTDLEYVRTFTPIDGKMVKQVSKALADDGFTVDEYLKWIFEEFLVENPKFNPPNIKWSCSGFVLDKFVYEHRHKMKERREVEARRNEMLALVNRARQLMRGFVAANMPDEKEKVKELLKKLRDEGIIVGEFRKYIEAFEAQLGQTGHTGQMEA